MVAQCFFYFFVLCSFLITRDVSSETTAGSIKRVFTHVDDFREINESHDFIKYNTIGIRLRKVWGDFCNSEIVYETFRKALANGIHLDKQRVTLLKSPSNTKNGEDRVMVAVRSSNGSGHHWLSSHLVYSLINQNFDKVNGLRLSFVVKDVTCAAIVEADEPHSKSSPFPSQTTDKEGTRSLSRFRRQTSAKAKECRSRGVCDSEYEGSGCRCKCDFGYNGPTCEQLKMTLGNDTSHTLSDLIPPATSFHLSVRYITEKKNGNGFIASLKAKNGQVNMFIFVLEGKPTVQLRGPNWNHTWSVSIPTNNNNWYRIDVIKKRNEFILIRDLCELSSGEVCTKSSGDVSSHTIDFNESQLTVGKPHIASYRSFDNALEGCIGDMRVNGKIMDLFVNANPIGCGQESGSCGYSLASPYGHCGRNGICDGNLAVTTALFTCKCQPGYRPLYPNRKLSEQTTETVGCVKASSFYFPQKGHVKWELQLPRLTDENQKLTTFSVEFRTVQQNESIYILKENENSIKVLLQDGYPKVILNTSSEVIEVILSAANASDGQWHHLSVLRVRRILEVKMDNLYYGFKYAGITDTFIRNEIRFIGNYLYDGDRTNFHGCMRDVRILKEFPWVPLTTDVINVTSIQGYVKSMQSVNVNEDNCTKESYCLKNKDCDTTQNLVADSWGICKCSCKTDLFEANNGSCLSSICTPSPCQNNGTCNVLSQYDRTYNCSCLPNYNGTNCEFYFVPPVPTGLASAGLATHWILLIVLGILLLLLLILLLLLVCYRRGKRQVDDDIYDALEEFDTIPEKVGDDCDGAGEEDFGGYIDIGLLRKPTAPLDTTDVVVPLTRAPDNSPPGGWKNPNFENDEFLDHPLEYGFEGQGSYVSLSSIASGSTDDDLNFDHMKQWGPRFGALSDLYGRPDE